MRSRLVRGLVAAALAVALGAGTAAPANAATPARPPAGATTSAVGFDWASLVISVAGYLLGRGGDINGSVQQILNAIESSRTDIINHTDAIADAQVQACVEANTIQFENIDLLPPPILALWAQDATNCATLAKAYLVAVQSKAAVDNLGSLVGPIFAIVFAARARAGLTAGVNLLLQDEISAYQQVEAKLGPAPGACVPFRIQGQIEYYTCTAYNGDTGRAYPAAAAWAIAAARTSLPIADSALPRLVATLNGG
jgi:hypothetical protein